VKPDLLMEWLKERAQNDANGEMYAEAENEITRLLGICVMAHDRILRGDSDSELLKYLQTAWRTLS
jgi:hypothetical protein